MYDPNNPNMGGGPHIMDTAMGGGVMNALHGGFGPNMGGGEDWRAPWKQAKMDWRAQRPVFEAGMSSDAWRNALMGWRDMRPNKLDFRMGNFPQQAPGAPMSTPPQTNPTQPPNYQLPLNPYGSYGG